jgi:hypothetical protein
MRKRSNYRPKSVISNPLTMLRPATKAEKDSVMLRFRSSLATLTTGKHPGGEEWRDMSDAINTVETLALGMGKLVPAEVMPDVNEAIASMVKAARRFQTGQGMRLDSAGLAALRNVLDVYEQCLDGLTAREMAVAQAETQRRVNELLHAEVRHAELVAL